MKRSRSLSALLTLCILFVSSMLTGRASAQEGATTSTEDQLWHNSQTGTGLGVSWTNWDFFTTAANRAKHIQVVRNVNGRLHAFMIGLDDQIWHNEQTGTNLFSPWTGWNYLSEAGNRAKSLLVVTNGDGRLHAFMIGLDDQVWHNDQTGTNYGDAWSDWNYLSEAGNRAKDLVVAANADGRLHAFMIGMDDQVWHNDQMGTSFASSWTGWNWLSHLGDKAKSLFIERDGVGRLHAFARRL